ncbi:MAG: gamma-glutamyl-phosphate reductase, partial [Nitrospirota bacterium]
MTIKSAMLKLAQDAKEASLRLARLNSNIKNSALIRTADELIKQADVLKEANKKDLQAAKEK